MKHLLRLIPLLLLFHACTIEVHKDEHPVFVDGQGHILLVHPTLNNIRIVENLIDKGLLTLPANYRLVGVYYDEANYAYRRTKDHLAEQRSEHIGMYGISEPLSPDSLFTENVHTAHYRELFERSEGVIFFGGPDIPPSVYGQSTHLLTVVSDPHRHYMELSFLFHLLGGSRNPAFSPLLDDKPDYRILGFCLGMQTMNVATGGSMIQDIPTHIYEVYTYQDLLALDPEQIHRNYSTYFDTTSGPGRAFHHIRVEENSHMSSIARAGMAGKSGQHPYVFSSHHQALDQIGQGFRVTAWSMDGRVAEAIEHTQYPHVMGVQFHPESTFLFEGEEPTDAFHQAFWKHISAQYPIPEPCSD